VQTATSPWLSGACANDIRDTIWPAERAPQAGDLLRTGSCVLAQCPPVTSLGGADLTARSTERAMISAGGAMSPGVARVRRWMFVTVVAAGMAVGGLGGGGQDGNRKAYSVS